MLIFRFDADLAMPFGPVMVGGGYTRRDGDPLSDDADLAYSQMGRKLLRRFGYRRCPHGGRYLWLCPLCARLPERFP